LNTGSWNRLVVTIGTTIPVSPARRNSLDDPLPLLRLLPAGSGRSSVEG
jgi:hypothetical protein